MKKKALTLWFGAPVWVPGKTHGQPRRQGYVLDPCSRPLNRPVKFRVWVDDEDGVFHLRTFHRGALALR